jgi:hypothetical protein
LYEESYYDWCENATFVPPIMAYTVDWGDGQFESVAIDYADPVPSSLETDLTHTYAADSGGSSPVIRVYAKGIQTNWYGGSKTVDIQDVDSVLTATAAMPGNRIDLAWTDRTRGELAFAIELAPDGEDYEIWGYAPAGLGVSDVDGRVGPGTSDHPYRVARPGGPWRLDSRISHDVSDESAREGGGDRALEL